MTRSDFPHESDLWRDANSTDYLVLPLAAGVFAHFAIASSQVLRDDVMLGVSDDARRVLAECAPRRGGGAWTAGPAPYARVRDLAFRAWATVGFWMPVMYASWKFDAPAGERANDVVVKWLRENATVPLVDFTLAGLLAIHLVTREDDELPLLCRRARRIRVELAERVRRDGLTAWPQIVQTVSSQWIDGGAARFALDLATAGRVVGDRIADVQEEIESRWKALQAAETVRARTEHRATSTAVPTISRADHESILHGERARSRALEERVARLQGERNGMAAREGRLRSRIDALTARLESLQERLEARPVDPHPAPAASAASAASGAARVSADALAGRQVLLYTGEAAGDAREAMRDSLLAVGADEVTLYWSDREPGPTVVSPETIVVIDVRFMSHSTSEAIARVAERSGAWHCITQRGAALLGWEVAMRLLAR